MLGVPFRSGEAPGEFTIRSGRQLLRNVLCEQDTREHRQYNNDTATEHVH
jgi:hypothetical protein